jgi:tetratricopeptide (TPR) repeat protein
MLVQKRACLFLLILCLAVYANSLFAGFVSDDIPAILQNPDLARAWRGPANLQEAANSLCYHLGGHQPFFYHLFNVILHCVNTLLAFVFLRLFFGIEASFWGAAVFAAHPAHAEAVAWISARPYLFLALAVFLSFLCYWQATDPAGKKLKIPLYIFSLALYGFFIFRQYIFLAFLPLFLLLGDLSFGRGKKNWRWLWPFFALAGLRLLFARGEVISRITAMRNALHISQPKDPLAQFSYSLLEHLQLLLWPQNLTLCHDPFVVPAAVLKHSLFFALLIGGLLFLAWRKQRMIFFSAGIFIIFLLPTYSPWPATSIMVAERYLYFPLISFSLLIALASEKCALQFKQYLRLGLVLLIGIYGWRTIARNADYASEERFWQAAVRASPQSANAHNSLGNVFLDNGDTNRAIAEYQLAIGLNPLLAEAYNNLAAAFIKLGRVQLAVLYLEKALQLNPDYAPAYNNLGSIYSDSGQLDKAVSSFEKAIELDPRMYQAHYNLALACLRKGDLPAARRHCAQARKIGDVSEK